MTLVFNSEGRELQVGLIGLKVMFDKVIILTDQLDNPFYLNQGNTISTKDGVKDWAPNLLDELTPGPVIFASNSFPLNKWEVIRLLINLSMYEEPTVVAYDGIIDSEDEVVFNGLPTGDSVEGEAKLVRDSGMAMIWSDYSGWQNAIKKR